jgi:selenocysteine-specific elongation factor
VHVIATAGHVDHGKSTLVQALTGIDPDRLPEEKERGLTIDLGFAWTTLPSGADIGFVDVPGHVRFIKNMLAGVGAVDAVLFVVAATEGWKPQSEEHLRILSLLGIGHGLIALTKVGLVDDEWRQIAELEVAERVGGTFLAGAEIVAVDAPGGVGIETLRAALDRLIATTPTAVDRGRPRLWIDRSFAAKGSGTVVTGTLTGGTLSLEDDVVVSPSGLRGRVRALQSHNRPLTVAGPGRRLAVNLGGVSHDRVRRGQALVRPGQWHQTRLIDASLSVLDSIEHDVSRRGAYVAYLGSGEHPVKLRVIGPGGAALSPGETGAVRLWLAEELPLVPGDRYVLREAGRSQTVGGGEVLDVAPIRPASKAAPDRSVSRVVSERGWIDAAELGRLTGTATVATIGGRWVVDPPALAAMAAGLARAIEGAGALGLDVAGLSERERLVLETLDDVIVDAGRARARGNDAAPLDDHPYVKALEASPFNPPPPDGVDRAELRELVRRGLVVESEGVWFAAGAIDEAGLIVAGLLAAQPDGVTVAAVRDALGTTRKHVLPLLARLDASGVTRRRGDVRIGGPRLPRPA